MLGRHKRAIILIALIWLAMFTTYILGRIDSYSDGYKAGLRHAAEMTAQPKSKAGEYIEKIGGYPPVPPRPTP